MRRVEDGPRGEFARYAFGWSDKKPRKVFWVIIALMVVYIVYHIVTLE